MKTQAEIDAMKAAEQGYLKSIERLRAEGGQEKLIAQYELRIETIRKRLAEE
jgi:hypothetical protein